LAIDSGLENNEAKIKTITRQILVSLICKNRWNWLTTNAIIFYYALLFYASLFNSLVML